MVQTVEPNGSAVESGKACEAAGTHGNKGKDKVKDGWKKDPCTCPEALSRSHMPLSYGSTDQRVQAVYYKSCSIGSKYYDPNSADPESTGFRHMSKYVTTGKVLFKESE